MAVDMDKLMRLLERHEGVVYKIYKDTLGYKTGGIGHLITKADGEWDIGDPISKEQVKKWFQHDVAESINIARAFLGVNYDKISDARRICIIDMCFNLGPKIHQFKRLQAAITVQRWDLAIESMQGSLWAKQVPNRAKELVAIMRDNVVK